MVDPPMDTDARRPVADAAPGNVGDASSADAMAEIPDTGTGQTDAGDVPDPNVDVIIDAVEFIEPVRVGDTMRALGRNFGTPGLVQITFDHQTRFFAHPQLSAAPQPESQPKTLGN